MLVAKNTQGELVEVTNASNDAYFCPDCQAPVMIKRGKKMRWHYAHYKQCAQTRFSEGETREHMDGKRFLYDAFCRAHITVELESYLPGIQQRPDLLVTYGHRKIAIEFQCSKIAINCIEQRTLGYHKAGIEVIWICGKQNAKLLNNPYRYSFPTLLFYKLDNQQLYLCNEKHTLLIGVKDLLFKRHYETRVSLQCDRYVPQRLDQHFLRHFYADHGQIAQVPKAILAQQNYCLGMRSKQYVILSFLWHKAESVTACQTYMNELVKRGVIKCAVLPCVDQQTYVRYVCQYGIQQLVRLGLLRIKKGGLLEKVTKIL